MSISVERQKLNDACRGVCVRQCAAQINNLGDVHEHLTPQ